MIAQDPTQPKDGTRITVRYWASARAAAGTASDEVLVPSGPVTLAEVLDRARERHDARFAAVVAACSVLVGDRPVGTRDHTDVVVAPGESVELLPPFAGG